MRRNCEVDAWASLFRDLVGTASFRLFSGNAVNDRGEATKAAGRWRLHCGFWNTHYAQRSSHGSVCIEKHAWGIFQGIVHRHLCNTDVRNEQMTVAHKEWDISTQKIPHAQTLTKSQLRKKKYTNITTHRQFCPINSKWGIIVSGNHRHEIFTSSFQG